MGIPTDGTIISARTGERAVGKERCLWEFSSTSQNVTERNRNVSMMWRYHHVTTIRRLLWIWCIIFEKWKESKIRDNTSLHLSGSIRARYGYNTSSTAPQFLLFVAKLFQITKDRYKSEHEDMLKLFCKLQMELRTESWLRALNLRCVYLDHVEVVVCSDAPFVVNNENLLMLAFWY